MPFWEPSCSGQVWPKAGGGVPEAGYTRARSSMSHLAALSPARGAPESRFYCYLHYLGTPSLALCGMGLSPARRGHSCTLQRSRLRGVHILCSGWPWPLLVQEYGHVLGHECDAKCLFFRDALSARLILGLFFKVALSEMFILCFVGSLFKHASSEMILLCPLTWAPCAVLTFTLICANTQKHHSSAMRTTRFTSVVSTYVQGGREGMLRSTCVSSLCLDPTPPHPSLFLMNIHSSPPSL